MSGAPDSTSSSSSGSGSSGSQSETKSSESSQAASKQPPPAASSSSSSSSSNPAQSSAPAAAPYQLTNVEQQVVKTMNTARKGPGRFADRMQALQSTHLSADGKVWRTPAKILREGVPGAKGKDAEPLVLEYNPIALISEPGDFENALAAIRLEPELAGFDVEEGLCLACQDHLSDLWENGGTSAMGSDASNFRERAARYGKATKDLHQIMVSGHDDPLLIVAWIAWNNSMRKKIDRFALFNPGLSKVGIACGAHPEWGAVTVILLDSGYVSDPSLIARRPPERSNGYREASAMGYYPVMRGRGGGKGCCSLL